MAAGGATISRLYDFIDGMTLHEYHLDNEFDRIHQWINGKLGDTNIAADADIQGTKLKVSSIPGDRVVGGIYSKPEIDAKFTNVNLVGIADRTVAGVKLALGAVGTPELADGGVTDAKIVTVGPSKVSGFLAMSTTARNLLVNPPTGMVIFNSTAGVIERNTGTPAAPVWTSPTVINKQETHVWLHAPASAQTTTANATPISIGGLYQPPFVYTAANWSGSSWYFDARIMTNNAASTTYAELWDDTLNTLVTSSTVSTIVTTYVWASSPALTLVDGHKYLAKFYLSNTAYVAFIMAARLNYR